MIKRLLSMSQVIKRLGLYNSMIYYIDVLKNRVDRKKYLKEENCASKDDTHDLKICFQVSGGFGDYLVFANYLEYFRRKYSKDTDQIDIYFPMGIGSAKSIFDNSYGVNLIDKEKNIKRKTYDLYIKLSRFPQIYFYREIKIKLMRPELLQYIALCKAFEIEHRDFFIFSPYRDGKTADYCIQRSQIRLQQPDIYGLLKITQTYQFPLKIKCDEQQFLKKWDLETDKYITIHHGCDVRYSYSTKLWKWENYDQLARLIKETFPELKIVQCGIDPELFPQMQNADINLVGKTTMEEVKALLKNSLLHIDNEGGLVHLRHALCAKKSIVLFGPTSDLFYGYAENENVRSNVCEEPCEWENAKWNISCKKIKEVECYEAECMKKITIVELGKKVEKLLNR
jgi:ADP-heptose:LPS heptosyltransferase